VIDQGIATDTGTVQSQQMLVPAADNRHEIAGVLHLVGVTGGFLFHFVRSVGS
jgi:hypothetical protein